MIESFVHNPVKVAVGVLLVALFGAIALLAMPMQLTPEVQIPTLTIETVWPGASPQEVERQIVQEQEEQLKSVEGITKLSSESMDSMGRITLEFLVGTNMQEALLKVNTKLQQVREYPADADQPVINTSNSGDRPIAWFILTQRPPDLDTLKQFRDDHPELAADMEPLFTTSNVGLMQLRLRGLAAKHPEIAALLPPEMDVTTLRTFCEDFIEAEFERVAGVSNSNVIGGREEEVQVIVDPQRLAARHLTILDVRMALRGYVDTSGGDFWEGKRRWVVRTLGQFRDPSDVESVILARRDGMPVYVRDVAEVRLSHKKPDGLVRRFGTSCIAINAQRETGANVLNVMDGLRTTGKRLNETILKQRGLILTQVYDETDYIYSSIGLVQDNIIVGGLLTVFCLLLFLRSGRSTLVIGLAIPTSIIGTFLVLQMLGRSLNVISLAGLAFAVGMLVDNAVVVLENIYRHHQLGKPRLRAVVDGTGEVWAAVLSSTLTTLAVFIPVLFVQEEAGQLFRDIALAISAAVGLSLLVSVVVIPTAAARILPAQHASTAAGSTNTAAPRSRAFRLLALICLPVTWPISRLLRGADRLGAVFVQMVVGFNAILQSSFVARLVVVAGIVATSVGIGYRFWPKVEYLPNGNQNLVFGILLPPPGYNLDQLLDLGEQIEADLRPYWDFQPNDPRIGDPKAPPLIGDFFFVARGRQVFLGIRALDAQRAAELIPVISSVGSKLPGTFAIAKQSSLFEQGLEGGRSIDIEITGPELTRLVQFGGRILGELYRPRPGANPDDPPTLLIPKVQARPVPSLDLSSPEIHVVPKWDQVGDMGVSAADLGYIVDALVDGAYAADYYSGADKIDLRIVGQDEFSQHTHVIEALPVATPTGQVVPLAALAHVSMNSGPEQVNHRERQRAITISVSPPPEVALEDAMARISSEILDPLINSGELGTAYQIRLAGTADKLRATWLALRFNVLLALLITYLLMAALFESWLYPFVIILSVPLGAVGGVLGLNFLNAYIHWLNPLSAPQALDVLTMLGFVILIGTVVNNPILIVEQALVYMRDEKMSQRAAILESVRTRIRPIFMTTTTTVLGLAPLVLFPGAGSELYRGLGSVVLGGLIVSTLVTLVLVPALFSLMMEVKQFITHLIGWDVAETEREPELVRAPAGTHLASPPPTAAAAHPQPGFVAVQAVGERNGDSAEPAPRAPHEAPATDESAHAVASVPSGRAAGSNGEPGAHSLGATTGNGHAHQPGHTATTGASS